MQLCAGRLENIGWRPTEAYASGDRERRQVEKHLDEAELTAQHDALFSRQA